MTWWRSPAAGSIAAYFQPITRGDLGQFFGKEVSRETISQVRALDFIAAGPRSPEPGAPYIFMERPLGGRASRVVGAPGSDNSAMGR